MRVMAELLQRHHGGSDHIKDHRGLSCVAIAVQSGDLAMLGLLLGRGLNPDSQDDEGNTPLHYAIAGKLLKPAELLLDKHANEVIVNNEGLTPWQMWTD